jgi:hypothetical protein
MAKRSLISPCNAEALANKSGRLINIRTQVKFEGAGVQERGSCGHVLDTV